MKENNDVMPVARQLPGEKGKQARGYRRRW